MDDYDFTDSPRFWAEQEQIARITNEETDRRYKYE